MLYGYNGKILHVDLNSKKIEVEEPEASFYRKYMGGSAMGAYYLFNGSSKGLDPVSPENPLCIMNSVVTGAPISGQSRFNVTAKSPITNLIGDSQAGGFWGPELKFAGFDGIVVRGKANKPVYLWIKDGNVELRDASHVWGRYTGDAEDVIRSELGDERIQLLQCGPAGENGVRFSSLINNASRLNGRTGMGRVMAAKNLRAIAVRGSSRPEIADPVSLQQLAKWGAQNYKTSDAESLGRWGTAGVILSSDKSGNLPTRNWESGTFVHASMISGQTMSETILKRRESCFACVVRCKRAVQHAGEKYTLYPRYGGAEYESLATLGSYCEINDLIAVSYANQLCNMYGMDTIACGATIAWAMDCFERGLISTKETGGLELRFGDAQALIQLVDMIGKREGFGRILAEGSSRAAQILGKGEELVMAVKNTELPAHMPQVKRSLALIYLVNPIGADHQSHEHDGAYGGYPDRMAELDLKNPQPARVMNAEKVRYALYTQYFYSCLDTLNICQFVFGPAWQLYGPSHLVDMVRAVTGWNVSMWELMKVGQRRLNMMQAYNIREGGITQDKLPQKLFIPLKGGASDGLALTYEEVEEARQLYYEMAGWDECGRPRRSTLEELDLEWVVDALDYK